MFLGRCIYVLGYLDPQGLEYISVYRCHTQKMRDRYGQARKPDTSNMRMEFGSSIWGCADGHVPTYWLLPQAMPVPMEML